MEQIENNFGLHGQSPEDWDEFLGLGKKARQKREERRKIKNEKKQLKNEERKAEIDRTRAETSLLQNPPPRMPAPTFVSPDPSSQPAAFPLPLPPEPENNNTMIYVAAGGGLLLLLAIGGYVIWKKKQAA